MPNFWPWQKMYAEKNQKAIQNDPETNQNYKQEYV